MTPKGLMDLPTEILRMILRHLVVQDTCFHIYMKKLLDIYVHIPGSTLELSVLRTCKALHSAGVEILFNQNVFDITYINSFRTFADMVNKRSGIMKTHLIRRIRTCSDIDLAEIMEDYPNIVCVELVNWTSRSAQEAAERMGKNLEPRMKAGIRFVQPQVESDSGYHCGLDPCLCKGLGSLR